MTTESNIARKRNISLNLLKLLTMMLIINSHSDVLYPAKISFLASGGGIGNELFFLISGYLFSAKDDIGRDVLKRFIKLYIPAYIMVLLTMLCGRIHVDSIEGIIKEFIWPTHFWFVGAILVYSIILYVLIEKAKIDKNTSFVGFGLIVVLVDLLLYIFCIPDKSFWIVEDAYISIIPFRSIYSIFAFVLGYYLKRNLKRIRSRISHGLVVIMAVVFFALFYGFKLLLNRGIVPMPLQILSQPLTIMSALFIFMAFAMMDLNQKLDGKRAELVINTLSGFSLESYLVQFLIIAGIAALNIVFPVNMVVCVVCVLIASKVLHAVDAKVIRAILRE